jgi:phosphatidylserine/phosphatidylglycerophosphate/cardiolipin synthase-like enzyme
VSVTDGISVTFLEDGQQPPEQVAQELLAFLQPATTSLDIAVYDCSLTGSLADTVGGAIRDLASRGVRVRVGYYAGPHESPVVAPQAGSSAGFLQMLQVPVRPIQGFQSLMHDKYVIRDAGTGNAAVWTGSTNWTADAWGREENVILRIDSDELAARYTADFEELWSRGKVENTGGDAGGQIQSSYGGGDAAVTVWFSPDGGIDMAHDVAHAISAAQTRIVVASPVLTDGPILGALADMVHTRRVPVKGVYDRTQMQQALQQWASVPHGTWKSAAFQYVAQTAAFASKASTPYAPGSVHDYMHVKILVADDTVFTGSYNFSRSGEENAENLLRIDSNALADACSSFVDRLIARYGGASESGA